MATRASADDVEDKGPAVADPEMEASEHHTQRHNAFAELMKPKPKPQHSKPQKKMDSRSAATTTFGRDGLGVYIAEPESFPESRVLYYDDKFVVINDLYPKASVHLLILPRDGEKNVQRGQEVFHDAQFLAECRAIEAKVRKMVAGELRRRFGKYSALETARREAQEADEIPDVLPPGRDWESEVMSGTHANPSMNHLHIHVLSKDLHSECLKKTNHYQSFTTDFFIRMDEYPLAEDDSRRHYRWFPRDMVCWRCGRNFGNKMTRLKEHLDQEFEEWRKI
ncbi:aprataxin-like protein [Saxophila tyrrhenica]|uniref:Aprataxin-like protein n=1 Tax=Saxophila tyrrhenica TaxID=1690608 RepID=A0AAV9P515_9PEZI|nr:aprataxin-like protein [Saxophila tyrrhenica]